MKDKEKSWLPVAGLKRGRVGKLPSQKESNKELEAIKCLLKQFSISDLSDIGVDQQYWKAALKSRYWLKEILRYAKIS